jgi:hypothetical protein
MIKVKQISPTHIEISMPNQDTTIHIEDGPAMLQALHQQAPDQTRVKLNSAHRLDLNTEKAALELAGLSGFAAVKQISKGWVEF